MSETIHSRIEYQWNEDDYRQYLAEAHAREGAKFNVQAFILTWVIIYPLVPFIPLLIARRPIDGAIIAGWSLMVFMGVYIVLHARGHYRKAAQRGITDPMVQRLMNGVCIELKPDCIMSTTDVAAGWYEWSVVTAIVRRRDRAYIWLGRTHAIVVPQRIFRSDSEFNSFIELACKYKYRTSPRAMCLKCSSDLRGNQAGQCPVCGTLVSQC